MTDQERLARLRLDLDACGGRGVELAEEIDELACELGECVYSHQECGWKCPASHPGPDPDDEVLLSPEELAEDATEEDEIAAHGAAQK